MRYHLIDLSNRLDKLHKFPATALVFQNLSCQPDRVVTLGNPVPRRFVRGFFCAESSKTFTMRRKLW
jgi:hypothetical protein